MKDINNAGWERVHPNQKIFAKGAWWWVSTLVGDQSFIAYPLDRYGAVVTDVSEVIFYKDVTGRQ